MIFKWGFFLLLWLTQVFSLSNTAHPQSMKKPHPVWIMSLPTLFSWIWFPLSLVPLWMTVSLFIVFCFILMAGGIGFSSRGRLNICTVFSPFTISKLINFWAPNRNSYSECISPTFLLWPAVSQAQNKKNKIKFSHYPPHGFIDPLQRSGLFSSFLVVNEDCITNQCSLMSGIAEDISFRHFTNLFPRFIC